MEKSQSVVTGNYFSNPWIARKSIIEGVADSLQTIEGDSIACAKGLSTHHGENMPIPMPKPRPKSRPVFRYCCIPGEWAFQHASCLYMYMCMLFTLEEICSKWWTTMPEHDRMWLDCSRSRTMHTSHSKRNAKKFMYVTPLQRVRWGFEHLVEWMGFMNDKQQDAVCSLAAKACANNMPTKLKCIAVSQVNFWSKRLADTHSVD